MRKKIHLKDLILCANIIIIFLLALKSTYANDSKFLSISDLLIKNYDWKPHEIGSFGQFYRLDVGFNGETYLDLHAIIKKKYGGKKRTKICDIFIVGRQLIIKNNHLIKTNYSEEKAKIAQREYVLYGKNLSDREWMLSDQYQWLKVISEGTKSRSPNQEIFNKTLDVILCTNFDLVVKYKNKTIKFPNRILINPEYLYLNKVNITTQRSEKINELMKKVEKLISSSIKNIKRESSNLVNSGVWTRGQSTVFFKNLAKNVTPENIILAESIC